MSDFKYAANLIFNDYYSAPIALEDLNANFTITAFATTKDAADNIINTVMNSDERIYIVAIGAITNVASAIIKCPEIANKAVVIWLGGHAFVSLFISVELGPVCLVLCKRRQ